MLFVLKTDATKELTEQLLIFYKSAKKMRHPTKGIKMVV